MRKMVLFHLLNFEKVQRRDENRELQEILFGTKDLIGIKKLKLQIKVFLEIKNFELNNEKLLMLQSQREMLLLSFQLVGGNLLLSKLLQLLRLE